MPFRLKMRGVPCPAPECTAECDSPRLQQGLHISPGLERAGLRGTYAWVGSESRAAWARKGGPLNDRIARTIFENPVKPTGGKRQVYSLPECPSSDKDEWYTPKGNESELVHAESKPAEDNLPLGVCAEALATDRSFATTAEDLRAEALAANDVGVCFQWSKGYGE